MSQDAGDKITVTLTVRQWWWLIGVLHMAMSQGENGVLDSLFDQVMEKTQ